MDETTIQLMAGLALLTNRAVESLKPYIDGLPLTDDKRRGLLTLLSLVIGIALAWLLQVNAFASLPLMTAPLAGIVVTGSFIGGGSNAVHWLTEVMNLLKANRTTITATMTQTTTTPSASTGTTITMQQPNAPTIAPALPTPVDLDDIWADDENVKKVEAAFTEFRESEAARDANNPAA